LIEYSDVEEENKRRVREKGVKGKGKKRMWQQRVA
jgi:hypothetical protein